MLIYFCCRFVDIFFREERMPIEEGWTKPSTLITGQTISPIANIIEETSEWVDNGGCPIIRPGPNSDIISCP